MFQNRSIVPRMAAAPLSHSVFSTVPPFHPPISLGFFERADNLGIDPNFDEAVRVMRRARGSKVKQAADARSGNKPAQLAIDFPSVGHGGRRPGAGRPSRGRRYVPHRSRPRISRHHPLHITLRVRPDVPNLRVAKFGREFRRTLAECCVRFGFRVVHYSVQSNHAHIIIEASNRKRLANGMKSLAARFARAINRVFARCGKVLAERYHLRRLSSPRQVRNALAYVLLNARKHAWQRYRRKLVPEIDAFSSGQWFDGWKPAITRAAPGTSASNVQPEVSAPRSWLLRKGWRRHRLIHFDEIPGA